MFGNKKIEFNYVLINTYALLCIYLCRCFKCTLSFIKKKIKMKYNNKNIKYLVISKILFRKIY